ncbi:MAG TPA: response regulator, partial [Rhodocyclaceae bacterium]|nr:response regulator [Rhodocyclaceae bacterium]
MSTLPRILIVDGSRVVRASLAKHLSDQFEIVEEDNGESAWQTLVLDTRIVAVVAGAQLPKITGLELVERLRENRLGRLKKLPFFLIISDSETEEGKHRAKALGVCDFLTKGMKKDEIMRRMGALVAPTENGGESGEEASAGVSAPAAHRLPEPGEQPRLLTRQEIEAKLHQSLDFSDDRDDPVSAVVLEVGNYGSLVSDFGQEVADKICGRFSQLLLSTIRGNDCIGLYSTQRCVIVSQGVGFAQCAAFADRLKASIMAARIAVQGQPVKLVVDAGVASAPEDGALSPDELLSLAAMRMKTGGG